MREKIRHISVGRTSDSGPFIWTKENGRRDLDLEKDIGKYAVILNGEVITDQCFEVEEYSDGFLRAQCYMKQDDGRMAIKDCRIQTEWREGYGSLTP